MATLSRGRRSRSARGAVCTEEGPGATNVHTRPAATSDPHVNATYGPRQSNHRISSARIGAPIRSANAHEVSNEPIARLRVANGTRWAIHACPATVRLPTPSTSRTNDTANSGTDPPSAIVDEAATASRPRQKTVRSWPRSSSGPVAPVVSPPSSATPMIPVSVPVVVSKARSSVGMNGPTHRSAALAIDFAPVSTTSWRRTERTGAPARVASGLAGGTRRNVRAGGAPAVG